MDGGTVSHYVSSEWLDHWRRKYFSQVAETQRLRDAIELALDDYEHGRNPSWAEALRRALDEREPESWPAVLGQALDDTEDDPS